LTQAFAVVTSYPGSAIYHILTFFALQAAFGIALGHRWRNGPESHSTRLAIAAGLAGAAHALLFILGGLGFYGLISGSAILPPLDRAIALFTLVLIGWALVFRPGRVWADVLAGFAVVGVFILYIALGIQWYAAGTTGLAYNPYDGLWELAKIGVIAVTLIMLVIFRPNDWGLGLGLVLTLGAGVLYHSVAPIDADNYPAAERIAEMAALPLFAVIVYRHALGSPVTSSPASAPAEPPPTIFTPAPARVALTPQAAAALAYIAVGSEETDFAKRIAEAVGRTLLADITLVFAPTLSEESLSCATAFDLIREKHLPGFNIPTRKISTTASAITRARPARLRLDTHQPELANLSESLGIQQVGPGIMVPFAEEGSGQNLGGIVVISPFTEKEWSNDDHNLLASIAKPLAKALASFDRTTRKTSDLLTELDDTARQVVAAQADARVAQERAGRLAIELEEAKAEAKRNLLQAQSLAAVIQAEAAKEPARPDEDPAELATLQNSYRRALEELAALNDQLAEAQAALDHARNEYRRDMSRLSSTTETAYAATLQADRDRALQELAKTQAILDQVRSDASTADFTRAETIAALQAGRDRFQKELADLRSELELLQQPAPEPARSAPFALGSLEDVITFNIKFEEAQAEIERLKNELAAVQTATASTELTTVERQLADANAEIARLRVQLHTPSAGPDSGEASPAAEVRSQTAMLVSVAQDLRQPLSSILGYTDLLLCESVGIIGALQRNFLDRVKASAERMAATLDDLIRVTAIDSGTLTLQEQDFDIMEVIEDAFTSVGTQFREKNISLRMDIADDLPAVEADRDAIFQIISRLLTNACAASEPNSEVSLTARIQPDESLLLSVRDTGGGIAEKDRDRVFARFYRADRPLIQGLGDTGVGLSIAKALAEAQGGHIWVESEMGVGSTFNVVLPTNGHH